MSAQAHSASVPEVYDTLMVPRLLRPWAEALIELAALDPGERVLDVASGTGIVARLAARRVGPDGLVVGTDISREMLDIARAARPDPEAAPIQYVECGAAPLDVPDAAFDVVFCQQGLQFFPERLAALREMRRALAPQGRALISVWGAMSDCPVFMALWEALRATTTAEIAGILTGPFRLSSPDALRDLCEQAGLGKVRVETHSLPLVFEEGVEQAVGVLRASSVASRIAELPESQRATIATAAAERLEGLRDGGAVRAKMQAHVAVTQL